MAGLALPKLRWLIAGAVATGLWVVYQEPVPKRTQERVAPTRQTVSIRQSAPTTQPDVPARAAPLPNLFAAPPVRPSAMVTSSIVKPASPISKPDDTIRRQSKTTARVRVRARPMADAAVVATLEPGKDVWELARSGKWRLVSIDGNAGWVHADYLGGGLRPKVGVPGRPVAEAALKKP